jgi:phosphatidylglycerophosphate synthase
MLDAAMRKVIDPPLDRLAGLVARTGVSANVITVTGFLVGMAAVPALAYHDYRTALALILVNRLFDGLDGAVARRNGLTDLGGFLDICLDFIFYSGVVFGMTLGRPADESAYGAFLIWSFTGPMVTFLAFAILAAKHSLSTELRGRKSLYYLGGLAEGTETLVTFVLFCLVPAWFPVVCVVYGVMCWITAATRIAAAAQYFSQRRKTARE